LSAGGKEYTLYFAYVDPGTAWDVSLARFDENIFDLVIEHDEGQIPSATIEVKNPHVGFLNPSRKFWAWISFTIEACPPQPLFFGRLVGIPEQLEGQTVRIKLIARADDYVYQKQQVARSLKVSPNYDPIFFDILKRDDPDAILEGWSALYHVDRVNNKVSASDILVGEDGTVHFAEQDVFYDSVKCKLLQSPLVAVNVKAEVTWEQRYRDQFFVGQWAWPTLGNDAFVQEWPKSGASIGGGWFAGISWAGERDPFGVAGEVAAKQKPAQLSVSISYTNKAKIHSVGDTMSTTLNYTTPFGNQILIRQVDQIGVVDPGTIPQGGDLPPTNIPAHVEQDWFCYEDFALDFLGKQSLAMLTLTYEAKRQRTERLEMTVTADVQPTLIDPLVVEDTEQITLKSGDLSLPLIDLENWDSVGFGGHVATGDFIYPDNPLVPGQTSTQIAVSGGTTGNVFPTFSNIAGDTTVDGTVLWASLGDTPPKEGAQDWQRLAFISLGTLLIPMPISGVPDFSSVTIPGQLNYPPTGTAVPVYSVFSLDNGGGPGADMIECTVSGFVGGFTGAPVPGFPGIPTPPPAAFSNFINPTGKAMFIAVQAGQTSEFHVTFDETKGNQTTDGTVIWQCIGRVQLPIGGWPGQTPAAHYFPKTRGRQSVEHMLCRARAKLRKRARAVEVSFDTRFEVAAQLSCRMNGHMRDVRLPGGAAGGKVISYKLEAHGDEGLLIGRVVLGCSVGKQALPLDSPSIPPTSPGQLSPSPTPLPPLTDPGIPSYVQDGYVQDGYVQRYSSVSGVRGHTA